MPRKEQEMSVDRNMDSIIDALVRRANEGLSKYGATTEAFEVMKGEGPG